MQVLNFYSTIFADELKRGRKTATIRLGNKSGKYRKNQAVLVTIGYQHSPRERIFEAVIDQVDVMKVGDLSPRDIKHDNPEFRRHEELINFLEQIYGRAVSPGAKCPFGKASTRDPSEARLAGTIASSCSSRTTTPPADTSRFDAARERLEDILLEGLGVVHD